MSDKRGNGGAPAEDEVAAAEAPSPVELAEPTGLEALPEGAEPPLTREALAALRAERDDLRDQLLRRRADFENFKKRVERDRQQAERAAAARVCEALLPVLDNLDRALSLFPADSPLRAGVEMIQRQILGLLEGEGVAAKDPMGERFDPELHQALSYEAVPGYPDGTIVEVYRKAYFLAGRLLRAALVKVARGEGGGNNDEGAVQ